MRLHHHRAGPLLLLFLAGCASDLEVGGASAAIVTGEESGRYPGMGLLEASLYEGAGESDPCEPIRRFRSGETDRRPTFLGGKAQTATLIGRTAVLTSAHELPEGACYQLYLDTPEGMVSFELEGRPELHPDFVRGSKDGRFDLAVGHLVEVPSLSIPRTALSVFAPDEGQALGLAGYGQTGPEGGEGHARLGGNFNYRLGSSHMEFSVDYGAVAYQGDSGGPTYGVADGVVVQYGVHVLASPDADWSSDIRVDVYLDDILTMARRDVCVDGVHQADDPDVLCSTVNSIDSGADEGNKAANGTGARESAPPPSKVAVCSVSAANPKGPGAFGILAAPLALAWLLLRRKS